jgi:nucleoside-diphosphate-sugar epimerase
VLFRSLAAILPPSSELNKDRTMKINGGGTENILEALKFEEKRPILIFASSVCVYGIPSDDEQFISEEHTISKTDNYSESKIFCERLIRKSTARYIILRISGISAADFFEFPDVLQFSADQRIEFIRREDVVTALVSCIERKEALWGVFNIAGGRSWQMRGKEYISQICNIMETPLADVKFAVKPIWFSWYNTSKGQSILNYQQNTFDRFLLDFRTAIDKAYGRNC